jgi:hypothetical protein
MALLYLLRQFCYRICEFLRHWYVKSFKIYANFVLDKLERIDRVLAWRINFRYLFEPLYGDYSFVGRILSFIIRVAKLFATSLIYLVIFLFIIAAYLIWLLFPVIVVIMAIAN